MEVFMLEINGLKKSFDNRVVIDDLNFTASEGEVTGIFGVKNAGKTVLLKLIMGILKPDSGKIVIDNKELSVIHLYYSFALYTMQLICKISLFRCLYRLSYPFLKSVIPIICTHIMHVFNLHFYHLPFLPKSIVPPLKVLVNI